MVTREKIACVNVADGLISSAPEMPPIIEKLYNLLLRADAKEGGTQHKDKVWLMSRGTVEELKAALKDPAFSQDGYYPHYLFGIQVCVVPIDRTTLFIGKAYLD